MEVTKVEITRDYALPGKGVYFKGDVFYVSEKYRQTNSTRDISALYDSDGAFIGNIDGHWFDFANKTLFIRVKSKD